MPGTFTIKLLADGQLSAAEADLYVCPAATTTIVKTGAVVNSDALTRVVNLYVRRAAGTSRRLTPKDTSLPAGYSLETDAEYTLGAGDAIRGGADAAAVVDFSIHGVEET